MSVPSLKEGGRKKGRWEKEKLETMAQEGLPPQCTQNFFYSRVLPCPCLPQQEPNIHTDSHSSVLLLGAYRRGRWPALGK